MQLLSLEDIATELDVYNKNGDFLQKIFIVVYEDLLSETIGNYDDRFDSWSEYLIEMRLRIKEYIDNPYEITWVTIPPGDHADKDKIAEIAIRDKNNFVVVEHLLE